MNDKKDRPKVVLVGMTGRLDSTVSAYLLKKQGHRVLGVGVSWLEGDLEKDLFGPWDLPDMNGIKKICDQLDIPFYGVHGHELFQAKISGPLVGSRLSGEAFSFQAQLHLTLIEVLLDKAEKLKADAVATGHYAKLTGNQTTGQHSLVMASDSKQDQSFLLAQLNQDQMGRMIFPLAEVRQEQVEKIKSLFSFELFPPVQRPPYLDSLKVASYVEENSAQAFHKEGSVLNFREGHSIGDHEGVHNFRLGQKRGPLKGGVMMESSLRVVSIDSCKGNVFVDQPQQLFVYTVVLTELEIDKRWDVSRPAEVFLEIGPQRKRRSGLFLSKNNQLAVFSYDETVNDMVPQGEQVVIYDGPGHGSKVIASARVLKSGLMTDKGIEIIPSSLEDDEDDENEQENKNDIKQDYRL